jgi:hypothetical protein
MSDTPRTKEAARMGFIESDMLRSVFVVPLKVAEELERDLAQRTAERDEARRSACNFKALYMDSRIGFSPMTDDKANTEARKIAARMRWDCFKEAKP